MIIDLPRFIDAERPTWTELEKLLDRLHDEPTRVLPLEEVQRFHLLYQKVSADLGRAAGRLASRTKSALVSYSYYGHSAFSHCQSPVPKILFQLHPHPNSVRRILRAEWSDAAPESRIGAGMQRYFELISTTLHNDNPGFATRIAATEARFVSPEFVHDGPQPEQARGARAAIHDRIRKTG